MYVDVCMIQENGKNGLWVQKEDKKQYMQLNKRVANRISSQEQSTWRSDYQWLQILICYVKYYKLTFNKMSDQQGRRRQSEEQEHDQNSQSEQQVDDEDQDDMGDFLVDDDQLSDEQQSSRHHRRDDYSDKERKRSKKQKNREKRRLKRIKQEQEQLNEDDLDVIEGEQIQGGRLSRLKKKAQIKRPKYSDEQQQQEEEIDDFQQRDEQELSQSVGGYRQQSEQYSGLNQAFEDEKGQIFQPEDEKRFFREQQDKDIIAIDIPERYYYQLRNYAKTHNVSIDEAVKIFQQEDRNAEAKWIYAKGRFVNGDERQVKEKIRIILEMLHRQKVQIMYIYYYRRKVYGDVLSRDDLWRIYKFDHQWFTFKHQFIHLRDNLMNVLYSFQEMPQLENMIQKTTDLQQLSYFKEFQNFKLLDNKMGKRKNIRNEIITQVRGKGIDQWLKKTEAFLSPQNLCHSLINRKADKKAKNPLYEPRQQFQRVLRSNNPQNDKLCFPLLVPEKRIQTICHYLELQLFSHPQLRKYLKEQYYGALIISTTPTKKGQQDINLYSQYFPVKKIKDKPIKTLPKQLWILAQQAEKKQMITIQLKFYWGKPGSEQKDFDGDEVFKKIISYYYQVSLHKEGELWNIFRKSVIIRMLSDYFFPAFFKQVKEELTRQGQQAIIHSACQLFKKKLLIPPKQTTILSMVLEDKKLGIVFVDESGNPHSPLQITLVNDDQLKRFANDEIIKKYLEDFKPQNIYIGANCRRAQTLRKAIRQIVYCSLSPYQIPSLVAKQKRLEGSTEEITVLEAISLARFQRNPLVETLSLWSDNIQQNGILSMNLHPFQSFVNQRKLKDALEFVAIEAVNLVGVDINQIIKLKQDASRKVLQFVCGFGPRKAFDFYEKVHNSEIINRKEIHDIVNGDIVYKNAAPFFKVETQSHKNLLKSDKDKKKDKNDRINLLDTTRIPPEWYDITEQLIIKAIKNLSLDMRQRKIYTNCEQKTIALIEMIKDPSKVNSIEWIFKREQSSFYDQKLVKEQIMSRFKMPNAQRYEFNNQELFYSLLRETRQTLKKYMIVTVKILSVNERSLNVVIPQNGLFGWIKIHDRKPQYQKGNYIKALILSFPFQQSMDDQQQLLKVEMGLTFPHKSEQKSYEHDCFECCFKNIIREIHPLIDLQRFDLRKQDKPVIEVRQDLSSRPTMKTQFRKISHRKFKNLAVGPAIELIKNSPIGDFVIRPSSQGPDFLNVTWHFFSGIIAHIKVRTQQKSISTSAPVYRVVSDKDGKTYESLDKLIDEYITPMNSLVLDVTSNRKFLAQPVEKIEERAKIQMGKEPSLIHYYFGCTPEYPQYFLLIYMYREKKPIKELIKVKSSGLYFHEQAFSNLRQLIAWFKGHCKQKDYQNFVKKYSIRK